MSISAFGQIKWNQTYQQYFNQYKDVAIEQMQRYNIPASITLAQGVFESGAGRSELAVRGNNHFGIKCNGWTGRKTYHDDDEDNECFRAYDSAYESYEDHSRFLVNSPRYRQLFSLKKTDYKGWAKGLKAAGYATNPQYANKLIEIIQLYKLYQYDEAKHYDKFMYEHTKDQPVNGQDLHVIKAFNKNYYIIVRQGESMYSIAQKYGIRVESLYKLNKLNADYQIQVGDPIRLR